VYSFFEARYRRTGNEDGSGAGAGRTSDDTGSRGERAHLSGSAVRGALRRRGPANLRG
jgi:hypothetical protein